MIRGTNILAYIRASFRKSLESTLYQNEADNLFWILIEEYTGRQKAIWLSEEEPRLPESVIRDMENASALLRKGYPVQYITGKANFLGVELHVNRSVLIPRPETEELVNLIISEHKNDKKLSILDIGTGSGCIAIALARHLHNAEVHALDVSEEAILLASENAAKHGVNINFFKGDILDNSLHTGPERYDLIVSNPPYVRDSEKALMRENVTGHEPREALFVQDEDPFIFYRAILDFSQIKLEWGGEVYFEINEFLAAEMVSWLRDIGYSEVRLRQDLNGKDRILKVRI